jgi:hypothetical protein
MHSSSQSIAAIASALAKAQTALVNPEKTMTATIRDDRRGQGAERYFRYAPLSAGLDLVRKALGEHEIALVQTTALDEATRTVRLNTVLAHSSGEWIASDWPVCPLSDISSPQRMGAALTYARRYAMFTLVGIAGEDDLDAPDLYISGSGPTGIHAAEASSSVPVASKPHLGNGRAGAGVPRRQSAPPSRPILPADESARLREGMLAEIESIGSSEAAIAWANTMLRAKNTLIVDDARSVEAAFETKCAALATDPAAAEPAAGVKSADPHGDSPDDGTAVLSSAAEGLKDRNPPITKTVRHRNKEHLRFVRTQPCLICAKQPSDPHHVSFAQPRALGRKVSDEYTVPLCRAHHREAHRATREIAWWQSVGMAPLAVAEALWQKSQSGQALNDQDVLSPNLRRPGRRRSDLGNCQAAEKPAVA